MQVNLSLNLDNMTKEQRESFLTFLMIYYNIDFGATNTSLTTHEFEIKVKGFEDHIDKFDEQFAATIIKGHEDTLNPQVLFGAGGGGAGVVPVGAKGTGGAAGTSGNANIAKDVGAYLDPQVLFGAEQLLKPQPYPVRSIVDAAPLPTAPVVTMGVTSPVSVPLPPVPLPVQLELVHQAPVILTSLVGLDNTGLPWDGRIHSSTKGKNKDGTWTARRGLDKALGNKIEAELRGVMSIPNAIQFTSVNVSKPSINIDIPLPPKVILNGDLTDSFAQMPPINLTPLPSLPKDDFVDRLPAPFIPSPFAPSETLGNGTHIISPSIPTPAPGDFAKFTAKIIRHINEKYITKAEVDSVMANYGISSMPLLINRPDLIPQISDAIDMFIQCK